MSPSLPDDLEPGPLAAALEGAALGESREVVAVAESTMDLAWAARDRGAPHGHLVLADAQTAGRGSYGRRWTSPGGQDLYLSVLLRPRGTTPRPPAAHLGMLAQAGGLAGAEVAEAAGVATRVKWPNDVVVARATPGKLAGVLVEARAPAGTTAPDLVVGIGLNVGRESFRTFDGAHLPATSLRLEGSRWKRLEALRALLDGLAKQLQRLRREGAGSTARRVEARLWARGEGVQLTVEGQAPVACTLLGLAPDGALRVAVDGETHTLRSGRLDSEG
ncbi:MAG: biotin--[acetyl-CoA-carboxylase] ligase [Myxococcota bacterium]